MTNLYADNVRKINESEATQIESPSCLLTHMRDFNDESELESVLVLSSKCFARLLDSPVLKDHEFEPVLKHSVLLQGHIGYIGKCKVFTDAYVDPATAPRLEGVSAVIVGLNSREGVETIQDVLTHMNDLRVYSL